ncbi:MAG: DUF4404 family protein [Steroidobacteraceae bacterium]
MSELRRTLEGLHEELGRAERLDPEDREMLATVLADIHRLLEPGTVPDATPPGEALEGAAVRLEAGHPGVASAIRALVDALAKAGI